MGSFNQKLFSWKTEKQNRTENPKEPKVEFLELDMQDIFEVKIVLRLHSSCQTSIWNFAFKFVTDKVGFIFLHVLLGYSQADASIAEDTKTQKGAGLQWDLLA